MFLIRAILFYLKAFSLFCLWVMFKLQDLGWIFIKNHKRDTKIEFNVFTALIGEAYLLLSCWLLSVESLSLTFRSRGFPFFNVILHEILVFKLWESIRYMKQGLNVTLCLLSFRFFWNKNIILKHIRADIFVLFTLWLLKMFSYF